MASLTGIFKAVPEPPEQDNDKLVDLFRNRAELKKEFASLREEKYRLQDRLKEHRASIERVEQKLQHLESLLLDPEWVHNVVTFYQLRRLSAHCASRLARFAEQLKQQREKRILDRVLESWGADQDQARAKAEAAIGEQRMEVQRLEDQLQAERHRLDMMGGLSRMLKGKAQSEAIEGIERALAEGQSREADLLHELEGIEAAEPPPNPGLDVRAKRSINFMILSYAQQLYLHYLEDNLVGLAKEAGEKSVGAVNYGGKFDCDEILERLETRREEAGTIDTTTEVLQQRAKLIAKEASFRRNEDAVPVSSTVATVFDISTNGVVSKIDASLLGENYFGLAKVLSR
jgi:chromosome segregation ATPase